MLILGFYLLYNKKKNLAYEFLFKYKYFVVNRVGPAFQLGPLIKLHVRFSRIQLSASVAPSQGVSHQPYVTIGVYFTPFRTMW